MKKRLPIVEFAQADARSLMGRGIDALDALFKEPSAVSKLIGSGAGAAAPLGAVSATSAATGAAGGAAIMQTLAAAGALVGGGALAGIAVLGVGSVLVGWTVTKGVKSVLSHRSGSRAMPKKEVTSKPAARSASKTLTSSSTAKTSKSAAGSALSQRKAPEKQTSAKAGKAASKTLSDGRTAKTSKSAAGSALTQRPTRKSK